MKKYRVFVDSDIILDLLARRDPHAVDAQKLFSCIDRQEIQGFVTPVILANLYYILRKLKSNAEALRILSDLKQLLTILPVTEQTVEGALRSDFRDFEDALQYHTAIAHGLNFLITRNKKDYKDPQLTVCTAGEFLQIARLGEGTCGQTSDSPSP